MRKILTVLAAVLVVAGLAACGEKQESTGAPKPEPLSVMLDFFPNADHVGIYQAQADGAFRKEGLDVSVRTPSDPAAPLKLLAAGKVDLAISYEPELLLARDRGLQLVSVGALVQRPLTSIIAIGGSKVRGVGDLRGKRVGTAGIPYQSAYLRTIEQRAGIPGGSVREVSVGFNLVPAMLSKKVDATLGGFWNYEGIQLRQKHRNPTVIPVDRAGVPTYDELVFVARRSDLAKGGARIRRFMRAMSESLQATRRDPAAAVDALVKANPDLDRKLQLASVRATLPAFFPSDSSQPFGFQDKAQWTRYSQWMARHGLIKRALDGAAALTNEFLPGQGI